MVASGCEIIATCDASTSATVAPRGSGVWDEIVYLGRATGLVSVPMPSIVIETTSPGSSVNGASGTSPAPVSR